MFLGKTIAVVMPAYNVANHIGQAIQTIPDFVDEIIVIDDASTDQTARVALQAGCSRTAVLHHTQNSGVGAAIATGYAEALQRGIDITVVMAGDGQMDPTDLPSLIAPIANEEVDYVKGNRFLHEELAQQMPRARRLGNRLFSWLTRYTSGYRHIFDSQCGYTAISRQTLHRIGPHLFPRYGYLNDLLARLNASAARVTDVPVRPIYAGQSSGIRPWTVLYPILFVVLRSYVLRHTRYRQGLRHRRKSGEPRATLSISGFPLSRE